MKRLNYVLLASAAVATPALAQAAPAADFVSLTSAIDVSAIGTAILAVAAIMILPKVVSIGVKWVLRMIPALGK